MHTIGSFTYPSLPTRKLLYATLQGIVALEALSEPALGTAPLPTLHNRGRIVQIFWVGEITPGLSQWLGWERQPMDYDTVLVPVLITSRHLIL